MTWNEGHSVSNHGGIVFNRLFILRTYNKESTITPFHWTFGIGLHGWPMDSPPKGPVMQKILLSLYVPPECCIRNGTVTCSVLFGEAIEPTKLEHCFGNDARMMILQPWRWNDDENRGMKCMHFLNSTDVLCYNQCHTPVFCDLTLTAIVSTARNRCFGSNSHDSLLNSVHTRHKSSSMMISSFVIFKISIKQTTWVLRQHWWLQKTCHW